MSTNPFTPNQGLDSGESKQSFLSTTPKRKGSTASWDESRILNTGENDNESDEEVESQDMQSDSVNSFETDNDFKY
jgi:hypothetical protein